MRPPIICLLLILTIASACSSSTTANLSPIEGVKQATFRSPLDGALSAEVSIAAPFENVTIGALEDSDEIIDAQVEYVGEMTFDAAVEGTHQDLLLSEDHRGLNDSVERALHWAVGLHPDPALDLSVSLNSGAGTLDATDLNLSRLALSVNMGHVEADLPKTLESLVLECNVASGAVTVSMPDGARVEVNRADVGSGELVLNIGALADVELGGITVAAGRMRVDVPSDAAVRIEIKSVGAGTVNLAFALVQLTGTHPNEGIWETHGFSNAEHQISIVVDSVAAGTFELE